MARSFTCIIILLVGIVIQPKAQLRSILQNVDEIEFTGGPSLVTLYNENITGDIRQPKVGMAFKIGSLYRINNVYSLNPSFSYERKGLKTKYNVWYYDPTIDSTNCQCTTSLGTSVNNSNMDYLTLATAIRFQPKGMKFFGAIGPYVSYLLKANTRTTNQWDNSSYYTISYESFNRFDFGISISFGYMILLKKNTQFTIQLSEILGVLNTSISDPYTRTNSISLALGINHKLIKR